MNKRLITLCITPALLALHHPALAQAQLPTEAQLTAWDAKFIPGRYRVDEYDVTNDGAAIASTITTREQCVSASEMQHISRSPLTAAFLWQCATPPFRAEVNEEAFLLVMACGGTAAKPVRGTLLVAIKPDRRTISSVSIKTEVDTESNHSETQLFGKGGQLTYLGECSATETQAKKSAKTLEADAWAGGDKPFAQEVAQCLRAVAAHNNELAYNTCKTALMQTQRTPGTEAEVALLENLGLLTGYVHKDEQLGYYQQGLAAAERRHGPNAPELVVFLVNGAFSLGKSGSHAQAAALFQRAVTIGTNSASKISANDNVNHYESWANALEKAGDWNAALAVARRAADYAENTLGPAHASTAMAWTKAGLLEESAGNLQAARAYFVKSLGAWENTKRQGFIDGTMEKIARVDAAMRKAGASTR